MKINKSDKILIFRSAFIGDFLVCLPFFDYLINDIGLLKKNIYFITINNQNFNPLKIVFEHDSVISKNSMVLDTSNLLNSIKKIKNKISDINFDKIIYLPFSQESIKSKLKKLIILKYIVGTFYKIYGLNSLKNFKKIYCSQYLSYFIQLEISYQKKNIDINNLLYFTKNEYENIKQINIDEEKKNIALYINSKLKMKIWTKENFYNIIIFLKKNYNAHIYLIGDIHDLSYNQNFIDKYKLKDIDNIAGKLSIRETFLFLDNIDLLISNDGAPVHIAAYTKCSILGLYTYKEPLGTWGPYISKRYITIRKNVLCKECYLSECKHPICLIDIKPNEIEYAISLLLEIKDKIYQHETLLL